MRAGSHRLPAIFALAVLAAGCGASSDPAGSTAKKFVTAVTLDDRTTWCEQVGEGLLVANRTGGLARRLLARCKHDDLFAITGACDREAVISGAYVTGDSVNGGRAKVRLSSGSTLGLQRSHGKWYITSISGGKPQTIKQGACAGA